MTPQQAQALIQGELSRRSRVFHVAVLIAAVAMGTVVASIWLTEPALPVRTQVAFCALLLIAAGWCGHATWVLACRAILLVPHQVRAARLALGCTLVFLLGGLTAWLGAGVPVARFASLSGLVMTGIAVVNLRRASRRHAGLLLRRDELLAASRERHA
jgi:hypothetical protein